MGMTLKLQQVAMMDTIEDKESDSENEALVASMSENYSERMNIYRNGYRVRLTSLLKQVYPALLRLLGQDAFLALSQDYLQAYPPRTASVFRYGHNMPAFLIENLGERDAVVELAELEWVVYTLAKAVDEKSLTLEDWKQQVETSQQESMVFHLVATASLQKYNFNSVETWQALVEKKPVPPSNKKPCCVLLWRNLKHELIIEQLSPLAGKLFRMLCNGLNLSQCCEGLASDYETEEQAVTEISAHLLNWINRGVFKSI